MRDYDKEIELYLERISNQIETYGAMIDALAEHERDIRAACMIYMKKNPETRKMSLEKIEIFAGNENDELKEKYLYLVYLRQKRANLEKIIEATKSGLSAVQSLMRYERL